eukprot:205162-Chlamydomonas_euryale.AAC.1
MDGGCCVNGATGGQHILSHMERSCCAPTHLEVTQQHKRFWIRTPTSRLDACMHTRAGTAAAGVHACAQKGTAAASAHACAQAQQQR